MKSFHPPQRVLLGPGPSEVSPRVLAAGARPTLGHLDPLFLKLMDETRAGLSRAFKAPGHACLPLPGPGTSGMEAALLNLLEPGDVAVICVNGVFGERMCQMAARAGAEVVRVDHVWGEAVDPQRVEAALWARGAKLLAFVHAETSTGVFSDPGAPLRHRPRTRGADGGGLRHLARRHPGGRGGLGRRRGLLRHAEVPLRPPRVCLPSPSDPARERPWPPAKSRRALGSTTCPS